MLFFGVKFLHVLAMAIWIGGAAVAPLGMTRCFVQGPIHATECVRRLQETTVVLVAAALTTLVTGLALIHFWYGWQNLPPRFHASIGLTLLVFLIGGAFARPTLNDLSGHFAAGRDTDSADRLRRRFLLIAGVETSLRIAVLALMVFPL